tara:strand:+ start:769 stop:987 length:219 start_codon:yes stop_codon:yes gene_type:complete
MKIGDLVKLKSMHRRQVPRAGLIIDLIEKKCWRTDAMGKKVDWNKVEPEPHAVVLVNGDKMTLPLTDLKVIG